MSDKLNQNEPDNFGALYQIVHSTNQRMNTFTPAGNYDLEFIVLEGKRVGNCISVDVDIFAADGAHKPTGASLANKQLLQAVIGTSEAEITFTLDSPLSLTSGQEYAVVVSCAGPNGSNQFSWSYGFSNTGWTGASTDSGSSWASVVNTQGMWFQAWGTTPAGQATDPSPASSDTGVKLSPTLSWSAP